MEILLILGALVISFALVMLTIPPIVTIAKAKKLFDPFDERKIHTSIVPPLGGVAIFIAFVLSTIIATDGLSFDSLKYIIAAVTIMFFIGLKDDILIISARKKFMIQVFAATLLIALGNIRFTNLHGILGLHELNYLPSISITLFVMIGIINAFNLIDGIDGLASGLATISSISFGIWFYLTGNYQLSIMSFALVGSLIGFFIYNVFGHRNKLFMGDTGSLIIGIVMSTFVIKFNELNLTADSYALSSAPAFSLAIVSIPIIDTLRVFSLRISNRKSPFAPDKNHLHHRLLSIMPNNHFKVTCTIAAVNIILIGIGLLFNYTYWNTNIQFLLILIIGLLFSFFPSLILVSEKQKKLLKTAKAS